MWLWYRHGCRCVTCGWLIEHGVSHDACIIYFLNNQMLTCPVSSAGWGVVIQRLKGPEFDSCCEHLFLNMIKILLNQINKGDSLMESTESP